MQTGSGPSGSQGEPSKQPSVDDQAEGQKTPKAGTEQQDPNRKIFLVVRVIQPAYSKITKETDLDTVTFLSIDTDLAAVGPNNLCKHINDPRFNGDVLLAVATPWKSQIWLTTPTSAHKL
jgi:hypothetical protein